MAAPQIGEPAPYSPAELEAVARLLLREHEIRVSPGGWWSYYPERAEVVYPQNLLAEWPAPRSLGALCHEIAEVLFSGAAAASVVAAFVGWASERGCEPRSAHLLFNAINDLRVNRLYVAAYPGSRRYFLAVYRATTLEAKDDLAGRGTTRPLPHHAFLDAVTARWAVSLALAASGEDVRIDDDRVRRALARSWSGIARAIASDELDAFAEQLKRDVFPVFQELLEASQDDINRASRAAESPADDEPPPPDDDGESEADDSLDSTDNLRDLIRGNPADAGPAESWVLLPGDQSAGDDDSPSTAARPAPAAPSTEARPPTPPGSRWTGGVVQKFRRLGRRTHGSPVYEDFNYVEAVRRLQPQVDAILHGTPGRDGLIAILNRRRFGTLDPWRRPRRRRRGDSGDIDADHPENLRLAPAVAFLKGQRQPRDDSQKDFAHAILLDVSGSIVQRGYRSRKFDQLIDTLVVFCEIHQRLKLPYELIAFSDGYAVSRSFDECHYDNLQIAPTSAYVVQNFSYLVHDMYRAEHGETHEAPALDRAIGDLAQQRGLKTIFVVTDGISSDRGLLTERLLEIEQRNQFVPPRERLMVLAFGLGLAESEFNASYQPEIDGQAIQCSSGRLVPNVDSLPAIVCDAVDLRIRTA